MWFLGTLQTKGIPNGKQRPFPFTHALRLDEQNAAHVWCPFFVLVPYLTAEIQEICLLCSWSNRTLPWNKCHFTANIAEVIRVIYALPGHSYKYTTQSMTVECQLKLSRHNSHERTWEHHLKYDSSRTTPNNNWREFTGNNFIYHVTNTFSEDCRSRDFIVVWELQHPLRVLPTFEDGVLIFSWKKVKFQAITLSRKLELSWKFLCNFRIQRPQISKVQLVSFP